MADVLSVLGTGIGVLSLVIQVIQDVVSYGDAVRGQSDQLKTIHENAEAEKRIFELLKNRLSTLTERHNDFAAILQDCMKRAEAVVADLEQQVKQYTKTQKPEEIKEKFRNFWRSTTYPFREQVIKGLRERLENIAGIRREAMQLLSLLVHPVFLTL